MNREAAHEMGEESESPGAELEQLPRRTQIRQLRRLAEVALAAYDLPPWRLTLMLHLFNTTFRVDTATGERYVLHIRRAREATIETATSELTWLAALRRDTDLQVPPPVPARDGALLTLAATPEIPRPLGCALFGWLPGRLLLHGLSPRQMELVGELMAHLHDHATRWERPPWFVRGRVDYPIVSARWLPDPFAPSVIASIGSLVEESLSAAEAMEVTSALTTIREEEQALMESATEEQPTFGLIHADLHYHNLLFEGSTVRAIDFDDCGFGPLLYDHAVMLSQILDWPSYAKLRAALLAGYRRVRALSEEQEARIDTFVALRNIQDALWVLEWRLRSHPGLRDDWAAQARACLAQLGTLISRKVGSPISLWTPR